MTFESFLLIIAKIGFAIFLLFLLMRWFFVIPYLWFVYDRKITSLKKELYDFRNTERKNASGRGIVQSHIDMMIASKTREIGEKLDPIETKRRLFIDRINIFLSIISIDKR